MINIRSLAFCASLLVCLVLFWFGTTAVSGMPVEWQKAALVTTATTPRHAAKTNPKPAPAEKSQACPLSNKFPAAVLQWCDLIQKYASQNELPAGLIAAVMLQESGGNPLSYSESGAVGLLQVMPRDGTAASFQCPNGPCFASRPTIAELQDPEYNISYGTRMLAALVRKYGSIREALKYYGPAGVDYYYADKVLAILNNYN